MAKAVSTSLYDFFMFCCRLVMFIVLGNPLSMFVLNLLAPHYVAEFAKNRAVFGETIYRFYEYLALKMPFYWAKWWMKIENIRKYSDKRQIKYFLKVSFKNGTAVKTLKAMMSAEGMVFNKACETLFFKYGDKELPVKKELRYKTYEDGSSGAYWGRDTVMVFMMHHIRLDYWSLKEVIRKAVYSEDIRKELEKYLASGQLCYDQVQLLIDAIFTDGHGIHLQMLGLLTGYVKRYGVEQEQMQYMKDKLPVSCFELVQNADKYHSHCKAVRTGKKDLAKWEEYCRQVENLLPKAQELMTKEQYLVYSQTGHTLDPDAVISILHNNSDESFWKEIFLREPNHGLVFRGNAPGVTMHTLVTACETKWNKVYVEALKEMAEQKS